MSKKPKPKPLVSPGSAAKQLLLLEGAAVMIFSSAYYFSHRFPVGWFAAGFLVPDLTLLGYLANKRVGAAIYNVVHTYLAPALFLAWIYFGDHPTLLWIPLVWIAHIGFDRALGFGLKYPTDFKLTHLQKV